MLGMKCLLYGVEDGYSKFPLIKQRWGKHGRTLEEGRAKMMLGSRKKQRRPVLTCDLQRALYKFQDPRSLGSGVTERHGWFLLYRGSSRMCPLLSFPGLKGKVVRSIPSNSLIKQNKSIRIKIMWQSKTKAMGKARPKGGFRKSNQLQSGSIYRKWEARVRKPLIGYSLIHTPLNWLQFNWLVL